VTLRLFCEGTFSAGPFHDLGFVTGSFRDGAMCDRPFCDGSFLGLKRKCIFLFSRKCENHAKNGRFSRNFFVFAKISFLFRENKKRRFSRKYRIFFAKIFANAKNAYFRE
jgi:hypothetical protein